jgi:hypothetical protein
MVSHLRPASLSLLSFLAMSAIPAIAYADDPPPPATAAPAPSSPPSAPAAPVAKDEPMDVEPTAPDYRVPMIATDLALMGAFAGSWTLGRAEAIPDGLAVGGAIGSYGAFIASGAIYHAVFDTQKKTALSVVVRSLAPAVFGLSVAGATHNAESSTCRKEAIPEEHCNHDGTQTGALVGALIGMLGATVAEATILVPDGRKPAPRGPKAAAFSITPSVATTRGGGQVGIAGTF